MNSEKLIHDAHDVLEGRSRRNRFSRVMVFMGPAVIASVAYMDPGNFATNIQGGAQFGYMLLWVVVTSNLMAILIQTLSAKLGLASGKNLAEVCREQYPPWLVWIMWGLMEGVAMATDLAEFLGAAVGFYLLFGIPLWVAGLITAVVTFLILGLERYGFRPLEMVITAFVAVIALCYLIETILDKPDWALVAKGALTPRFADRESILLAAGILGAQEIVPFRTHRYRRGPWSRRRHQRFDADHGRLHFSPRRDDLGRLPGGGAPNPRALARTRGQLGVRDFPAGLRPVVLLRRHDGRPSNHAGLSEEIYSHLAQATGDHGPDAGGHCHRSRSDPDAGDQSGHPEFRPALCDRTADPVHPAARYHGRDGEQAGHHGNRLDHRRPDHRA